MNEADSKLYKLLDDKEWVMSNCPKCGRWVDYKCEICYPDEPKEIKKCIYDYAKYVFEIETSCGNIFEKIYNSNQTMIGIKDNKGNFYYGLEICPACKKEIIFKM